MLLPLPFGPMMPRNSLLRRRKSTPLRISCLPMKSFTASASISISGSSKSVGAFHHEIDKARRVDRILDHIGRQPYSTDTECPKDRGYEENGEYEAQKNITCFAEKGCIYITPYRGAGEALRNDSNAVIRSRSRDVNSAEQGGSMRPAYTQERLRSTVLLQNCALISSAQLYSKNLCCGSTFGEKVDVHPMMRSGVVSRSSFARLRRYAAAIDRRPVSSGLFWR